MSNSSQRVLQPDWPEGDTKQSSRPVEELEGYGGNAEKNLGADGLQNTCRIRFLLLPQQTTTSLET